jgi:Protein of unknown function (DUF751)
MQNLLNTLSKYPSFIIGVLLGVFFNAASPLAPLFKNPVSAIGLVGLFVAAMVFLSFTLRAMLGISPMEMGL